MGLGRRSAIQLFGGGLLLLGAGCTEDQPDHRRGLSLKLFVIDPPPADAEVIELEDESDEQSLLYTLSGLLINQDQEVPREYSQRNDISISRGTTDQSTSNGNYLFYKSTQFGAEHEATHEMLKELPRYEPESGPWTVLYLQFRDSHIRFEYRVLYSTPS